jgi:hypothetical protein
MKIRYQIRTVALVNIVSEIKSKRLIPNAYFQRSLVWRDIHKREFIDTILQGYPFPQLFFSRGKINVETMSSTACIVDGQQRANAILEYVNDEFQVGGRFFSELSDDLKGDFLKYEVGVVELDLDNDDPRVKEMFKRVNRTSNSLTAIEKMASEYGSTEFMVVAKVLSDELSHSPINTDEEIIEEGLSVDPGIEDELFEWANSKKPKHYQKLLLDGAIFTQHEINRKIPLMYTLNIMSTIHNGFFKRNEATLTLLEDYKENYSYKDDIVHLLDRSAFMILKLKLAKNTMWRNKASFFSLIVAVAQNRGEIMDVDSARTKLIEFEKNIPEDYSLAAKEAVNDKASRELRDRYVRKLIAA